MTQPLVSVIVPVYNCRDTVGGALESALGQTLPPGQVEVIAVDDGSTDGGAELLDELARAHDRLTVVHQPNSGGAGAPRNRGLERASGTFVFFLDADDRLGPEALARMTEMAERNGTDVVLGKQVGTGGRKVPTKVFERTIERTHVLDAGCDLYPRMSMAALQLFRRSLIDRAGLRFSEGLLSHEDQLFTAGAYLNASGVSVLAGYDCYYWADRADGTSSTQVGGAGSEDVYRIVDQAMAMVAEHTEPGERRERLHYRYLQLEVFSRLERLYPEFSADEQKITRIGCRALLEAWGTPTLLARYNALRQVIAHCVLHGLDDALEEVLRFHQSKERPRVLLEDGRAYARYPFFRDESIGIPDACFETTPKLKPALTGLGWGESGLVVDGTVLLQGVDEGTPTVHLVVKNGDGATHRIPCTTSPGESRPDDDAKVTAFTGTFHPSGSWTDGHWTLAVEASLEGHTLTEPLTKPRGVESPHAILVPVDGGGHRLVRAVPVRKRGPLGIEVGGALDPFDLRNIEVGWGTGRRLRVAGEPPPVTGSGPAPDMSLVLRRPGSGGRVLSVPLRPDPDRPAYRVAEVPLAGTGRGQWQVSLHIEGVAKPVRLRVPDGEGLTAVTASVLPPRRVHARLNPMTLHVTLPLEARLRRTARRLLSRSGEPTDKEKGSA